MKYKQAIGDFKKVLQLEPKNDLVKTQMDATQKILRKVEFEKVCRSPVSRCAILTGDSLTRRSR